MRLPALLCLSVCLSVSLSVCLLARLLKNALRVDGCRDMDKLINF